MRRRADRHQSDLIVGVSTIRGGSPGDFLTINSHHRLGSNSGGSLGIRTRLLADTAFYVSQSGNDANSGLVGFPKATLQAMWDDLHDNYDCAGFLPTINVADSVTPYSVGVDSSGGLVGGQSPCCQIIGNEANPENVTISTSGAPLAFTGCDIRIAGMKLKSAASVDLFASGPMTLRHRNMWFADAAQEFFETHYYPAVVAEGPTRLSGRCRAWAHATEGGLLNFDNQTINLGAKLGTFTVSIASPAVVTWTAHGQVDGTLFSGKTSGTLPTGIQSGQAYFIKYIDADHFQLALTPGGTSIITTGSQSGTHTGVFDPPRGDNYSIGVNRSQVGLQRTDITGWFVAGTINGVPYSTTIAVHFLAILNLTSATGVEGLFPYGMTPMNVEKGGEITYDTFVEDVTYLRNADAYGNSADGYTNTVERAFKDPSAALTHMARRAPDPGFAAPTLQFVGNYGGTIVLIDLPGVPVAHCRGNIADPTQCAVLGVQNTAINTQWIVEGFAISSVGAGLIDLSTGSNTILQNCIWGAANAASAQITVRQGAQLQSGGVNTVTGDAGYFLLNAGGDVQITHEVIFTGARTYSQFTVFSSVPSKTRWTGTKTVSVSVTGVRVALSNGAYLNSNNSSSQLGIPGSVDGVVDSATFAIMT